MVSEGLFAHVLLELLLKVFTEIKSFPMCPTSVQFLTELCFLVFSCVKIVFQDQTTHLAGVGLLGKKTCLGSPDL